MNYAIVLVLNRLIWLVTLTAMAGCGNVGISSHEPPAGGADSAAVWQDARRISGRDVLRIREDLPRNRLWVLALDEVRVYNTATARKELIRKIALPNWSVVGLRNVCMPDLALDRAGSAFISGNGQARLLRIDTDRFELTDSAISFNARDGLDTGFGALAFAADGALLARTTPGGWLWKIDIARANAIMLEGRQQLPLDECVIKAQLLTDIDRSLQQ